MDTQELPVETDEDIGLVATREPDDSSVYTLLDEDTIWRVAKRFGVTAEELAEHNDIPKEAMGMVGKGDVLHLPIPREKPKDYTIQYQTLTPSRLMHVVTPQTRKWSFGNAKTFKNISPSGPSYKQEHELIIVGVAQVPLETGEILGYYMDKLSWGDYDETGIVSFTTGFSWTDLAEGPGKKLEPLPKPLDIAQMEADAARENLPSLAKKINPNQYKATYVPFEEGPMSFIFRESIRVNELDGRRNPKNLLAGQEVVLAGTFKKNGRFYGRPQGCLEPGLWYGVPMNKVYEKEKETAEDKALYTLSDQVTKPKLTFKNGRLTIEERLVTVPLAKVGSHGNIVVKFVKQKLKEIK